MGKIYSVEELEKSLAAHKIWLYGDKKEAMTVDLMCVDPKSIVEKEKDRNQNVSTIF